VKVSPASETQSPGESHAPFVQKYARDLALLVVFACLGCEAEPDAHPHPQPIGAALDADTSDAAPLDAAPLDVFKDESREGAYAEDDADIIEQKARALGIDNDRALLIYGDAISTTAARQAWTLEYYGHGEVRLVRATRKGDS
jgi:hypothetical protein